MRQWPTGPIHSETVLFSNGAETYSLIEPLGEGGNSTSFLALCKSGKAQGTPFAVKLFTSKSELRRKAFLDEISFLQMESHPAILPVYDFGQTFEGVPYYVSRLMATTLHDVIQGDSASTLDKLLYATQLCAALTFLAGLEPPIIHRDIKPKNVFVNGRTCVLGDFGMMQREGELGVEPGTPTYFRTPELVRYINGGSPPTQKSDVFQLGLVLYVLLTGANPLRACESKGDPIQLEKVPALPPKLAPFLGNLLAGTLVENPEIRPTPKMLLDVFAELVKSEGRRRHSASRE